MTASYAGLVTPRGAGDVLPARLTRGIDAMNAAVPNVRDAMYEGRQLGDQSRVLARGLGATGLDIYAYPTSKGRVCFTTSRGGGGCVDQAHPFAWGAFVPSAGDPAQLLQVIGLVPNNVKSVSVVTGGASTLATLRRNAFFYESAYGGRTPDALVLAYRDGHTEDVAIPQLRW